MKKRYVILLTVLATLAVEAMLFRWWITRDMLLSWIEPGPAPATGFVLTKDVSLHDHEKQIGSLRAGQRIFHPCRHDLFLTEPFDPQVYKIYVEFGGMEDPRNYVALRGNATEDIEMRNRLYLYTKKEGEQSAGKLFPNPRTGQEKPQR
jgi:hypothetical protein